MREANEKLTSLSVQKDAFLSQISHELRTPMTSIRAVSEILMSETMSEADQAKFSKIIHEEAIRLTRLLDDLLELSVLENGQVTLNWRESILRDVLDRAISAAGSAKAERPLEIKRDSERENVAILTDADRLAQVFINLIANARKYCDADEPRLSIAVQNRGDSLWVDFTDNGHGIARQNRSVIFEKFSRLSDKSQSGGAGLGLAICREIMDKLGGAISYLPGRNGAAFRVKLPIAAAKAEE